MDCRAHEIGAACRPRSSSESIRGSANLAELALASRRVAERTAVPEVSRQGIVLITVLVIGVSDGVFFGQQRLVLVQIAHLCIQVHTLIGEKSDGQDYYASWRRLRADLGKEWHSEGHASR